MKKLMTLAIALLGSLALTTPAHAFLIDGFGDDQDEEVATADDPGTIGDESNPGPGPQIGISDTDFENALRQLTVTQEGGPGDADGNEVTIEVIDGVLAYSQDTRTFGTGTVDWEFDAETFTSPIGILLNIIEADNDLGTVTFSLGGTYSDTLFLPEVDAATEDPVSILFMLNGFPGGEAFESASLLIDGESASALDLTVDFIEVPTPGVLGLLGIGLAGLGFAAGRRRNQEVDA